MKYLEAFLGDEKRGEARDRDGYREVPGKTAETPQDERATTSRTRHPSHPAKPAKQEKETGDGFLPVLPGGSPYAPVETPSATFPWPNVVPGLGLRTTGPFAPCAFCRKGTWVRYGGSPRCLECAWDPKTAAVRLYHRGLERLWVLNAQVQQPPAAEVAAAIDEVVRLMDEVGEPDATELRRQWARRWHEETGVCPWCGTPGDYHEVGDD